MLDELGISAETEGQKVVIKKKRKWDIDIVVYKRHNICWNNNLYLPGKIIIALPKKNKKDINKMKFIFCLLHQWNLDGMQS